MGVACLSSSCLCVRVRGYMSDLLAFNVWGAQPFFAFVFFWKDDAKEWMNEYPWEKNGMSGLRARLWH